MDDVILSGLNTAQAAAVTSDASVLQVLAPPGSGKTKTLTARVAYLLSQNGYKPQNVICCTFTIKASREMRERLTGIIGSELESKLVLGTFHSICRRYLAAYGYLIGIPKGFGIADTSDSNSIIKRIVKKLNLSIDPKTARSKISHHKAKGKRLEDLPKIPQKKLERQEFITIFHEYQAALTTSNLLDYDDLLLRCVDLLRLYPNCVSNIEALLIDEFQDTNVVQFELMKLLASANRRITVVGDPDQSIYGFRSAEVLNLQRMKTCYPETIVINLEENYRSSSAILKLAQKVIEQDNDRPNKSLKATHVYGTIPVLRKLPNPYEEALWITHEIRRTTSLTGGLVNLSDIAVLIRSAYLSLLIEKSFTRAQIPYRIVGGQRFFDRAEIRLVVNYLRTISHPDNNSALLAIINTPSRKIGETTLAILVHLSETKNLTLWSVIRKVLNGELIPEPKLSKAVEQELNKLSCLINTAKHKIKSTPAEQVPGQLTSFVVSSLKLEDYLKAKYKDDYEERIENIQELVSHASEVASMPESSEQLPSIEGVNQQDGQEGEEVLAQFLANVVLSTETEKSENEDEKPRITISTIHSAKGLEWPVVFVPAMYEGSIPHSRAEDADEERRLLYVAMTRAKALLTLTFPLMQPREESSSVLTRFLPTNTKALVSPIGPVFSDQVVSDIAAILRRSTPSQADLARGLENLQDEDSHIDDIWPDDGTSRSRPPASCDRDNFDASRKHSSEGNDTGRRSEIESRDVLKYGYMSNDPSFSSAKSISTTMTQTSQFSMANMSLSFTTANHQLKTKQIASETDIQFSRKEKPKASKATKGKGNLMSFLSQKSSNPTSNENNRIDNCSSTISKPQSKHDPTAQPLKPPSTISIPQELSTHKLKTLLNMNKRPRPSFEKSSPDRKRYVFLSSSPNAEDRKVIDISLNEDDNKNDPKPKSTSRCTSSIVESSKPATTMHVTSMSSLEQMGTTINRKTLGVRRSMTGWDDRKHQ